MSYAASQLALESHFNTNWGATTPIAWQDVKPDFDAGNTSEWVLFSVLYGEAYQASLGLAPSNFHRFTGIVTVQVYTVLDIGSKTALEYADLVVAMFTGNIIGTINKMGTAEVNIIGDDGFNRYQVNVSCPFYYDAIV